jgi:hypothetical protein
MTHRQSCEQNEALTPYLYGECPPAERRRIEAHLEECGICRRELAGLREVRQHLGGWRSPEPTIGFRIVPDHAAPSARPPARSAWWPAGLAAAAVLVLAAAASLANLEIRHDAQGLVVTTGWGRPPIAAPVATPAPETWSRELVALEHRLRQEFAEPAARAARETDAPASPAMPAMDDAELLRRVRSLIQDSERRQQRDMALRLTELVQEFDRQRQMDLVRVQRGLGRLEQLAGAEMAQQRGVMNYLVRASQRQQ